MSIFTRTPPAPPARVLVASGRRVDLTAPTSGPGGKNRVRPWQEDAWAYRDAIGEIRYAMGFLKFACSKVRLTLAVTSAEGDDPLPLDEATDVPAAAKAAANDVLARLSSGTFQYGDLLSNYAENLEVPGECYLVGREVDGTEDWGIYSIDELKASDAGWRIVGGPNDRQGELILPGSSYVARLWTPHPRWRRQPDSPMRALLEPCEELQLVSAMIRRASRSRLASAGIFKMPSEIDFSGSGEDADDVDADPFQAELQRAMLASVQDETDPRALVPIVVTGPGEHLKNMEWILPPGTVDAGLLARVDKALSRIATGLDVPPEIITGMADVNHWTAWQVDDSTFENHIEPLVIRMVDGLTAGYLRPLLGEYGVDPATAARIIVWFDPSDLVKKPNRGQDAQSGHSANVLSDRVLAEALGFNPDEDMPDPDELARRVGFERARIDAPLAEVLLRYLILPNLPKVDHDITAPPPAGPPPGEGGDPNEPDDTGDGTGPPADEPAAAHTEPLAITAASKAKPGPVLRAYPRESKRLANIDRGLRDQLTAGMDAALSRAIERATNRIRTQANRDASARAVVASVTARQLPGELGRPVVAALGLDDAALMDGAWDHVASQWSRIIGPAQAAAVTAAAKIAGVDPAEPKTARALEHLTSKLSAHADDAIAWLTAGLDTYATALLYDPSLEDEAHLAKLAGENPGRRGRLTSLARGAIALAGGTPDTHAGITDTGVAADPAERLAGMATGDLIDSFLTDAGTEVIGYEWVYGISLNSFPPHLDLDGVMFAEFGDDVLANSDGWPADTCAPGDHEGCNCDADPVYGDGTSSADTLATVGDATYDPSYMDVLRSIAADDQAAGRTETDAVKTVAQADRIANVRPSGRN